MEIKIKNNLKVVTPSDGKMLYNGEFTSEKLYMPIDGDESIWQEIDKPLEDEHIDNEVVINELKRAINGYSRT